MKITKNFKLNGSRRYLLKRLLAFLLIRVGCLRRIYFLLFPTPYSVNVDDVEQIFIALKTERELENIWFINEIARFLDFKHYIDIGCNYSQFASALNIPEADSVLCDLNEYAISYSREQTLSFRKTSFINAAIVSSSYDKDYIDVAINNYNSGLSSIIEGNISISNSHSLRTVKATKINSIVTPDLVRGAILCKIDVEGQESSLAYDLVTNSGIEPENILYCCEVLNSEKLNEFRIFDKKFDRKFLYIRYKNFSKTGLVYKSPLQILKILFFGNLIFEVVIVSNIDEIEQEFIPLLFSIPSKLLAKINFGLINNPAFR